MGDLLFIHSLASPYGFFNFQPTPRPYSLCEPHQATVNMGVKDVLSRKEGVIVGDDVLALFKHAQENNYAIPAVNVTSSSTVVASLEAARDANAPIILQTSQGGAAYFAGKGVKNDKQQASIAGAVAAAHYIRSVAPAYGIPVVLHTDHCAKKLLPWLDGMMDADEAYFKQHGEPLFSSHMIDLSEEAVDWNVETTAKYLKRAAPMKQWLEMEIGITGGEGDGVNNESVCKVNLNTDLQYAYTEGIRDYMLKNKDYLMTQVGNPDGADKPNKKFYDPRVWVREGEKTMTKRVAVALEDFNASNKL